LNNAEDIGHGEEKRVVDKIKNQGGEKEWPTPRPRSTCKCIIVPKGEEKDVKDRGFPTSSPLFVGVVGVLGQKQSGGGKKGGKKTISSDPGDRKGSRFAFRGEPLRKWGGGVGVRRGGESPT